MNTSSFTRPALVLIEDSNAVERAWVTTRPVVVFQTFIPGFDAAKGEK